MVVVVNRASGKETTDIIKQEFLCAGNSFWCYKYLRDYIQASSKGIFQDGFTPVLIALEQAFVVSICKVGEALYKKDKEQYESRLYNDAFKEIIDSLRLLRDKHFAHIDKKYMTTNEVYSLFLENQYDFDSIENMLKEMAFWLFDRETEIPCFRTKDSTSFCRLLDYYQDKTEKKYGEEAN